jgi:acetylornithine deacetylase/succinyl-diaminopimelate desuccinylase-like protein
MKATGELMAAFPQPPPGSDWFSTLAPTIVRSGDAPNSIPGEAQVTFSYRFVEKDGVERLTELIRKTTGLEPATLYCVPPVVNDPGDPLIRGLFGAMCRNWPERKFRMGNLSGATDAFQFADLNLPTVIFSHDGALGHQPGEHGSLASAAEYLDFFTNWIPKQ